MKASYRKYHFSAEQREALYLTWDKKCFYCRQSLKFKEMTIDHVVPEWLAYNPTEYTKFLETCPVTKIFEGFEINDYCNWVPAHGSGCNFDKGEDILPPEFIILCLHRIKKNLSKIDEELEKLRINKKSSRILANLETRIEKGNISEKDALDLATKNLSEADTISLVKDLIFERNINEPLIIILGLNLYDAKRERKIAINHPIAHAYDFLEKELIEHIRTLSPFRFYYLEESFRDGEVLGVRLIFPDLTLVDLEKLDLSKFDLPCWKLNISHFYEIYRMNYSIAFEKELQKLQIFYQPQ